MKLERDTGFLVVMKHSEGVGLNSGQHNSSIMHGL